LGSILASSRLNRNARGHFALAVVVRGIRGRDLRIWGYWNYAVDSRDMRLVWTAGASDRPLCEAVSIIQKLDFERASLFQA